MGIEAGSKIIMTRAEKTEYLRRCTEDGMTMNEWDKRIAPRLQAIGSCYARIAVEASKMQHHLEDLPARPAWSTLARDNLNKMETMLRMLLADTQRMQRQYDNLPIIIEFTDDRDDEQLRYETETANAGSNS